ncbi:MAG: ATP-dependent DNA helicase UvrD2 [Nanoarchaeota archaeon]|nr:ATP-dependent DNA helicase UvrD2 [Nanoarchaeota archaeon]MBU1005261.1 ATP-dependent DNA helicase UvrD2 [Nanoarchaeota archaeon]MBU1946524.1 ATP-dependent DNA helicase UvrD2 [Nanoarchaeota archaeon]
MNDLDYLFVLKALNEIPFGVGRKLLIDYLRGNEDNESIKRNKLHLLEHFGSLTYEKHEINQIIDNLLANNLIGLAGINSNKFWKVLEITKKGIDEISDPSLYKKKIAFNLKGIKNEITEQEKQIFSSFDFFLKTFSDEQKKAIICSKKEILCIAGAGSGKTTALTKRIEFMIKYRSIDPKKILAITFTRKARQEMMKRLPETDVMIETFNSFCEKMLRQHQQLIYNRPVRVINYRDKIIMVNKALSTINMDMKRAIDTYFSYQQKRSKTDEQLARIFMNDCFFLRDYFKFKNKQIQELDFSGIDAEHKKSADMLFTACSYIEAYMKKNGLRDFADQLIDTIALFTNHPETIPRFEHILVDEYQDVNSTQIKLIDLLNPENLFCVGDPRQAIFGWRGSDVKYILNFKEKYHDCEITTLTKNYRSTKSIVDLINRSIKSMGMPDLESEIEGEKDIKLLKFNSEQAEFEFLIQAIANSKAKRNEIFVLARTNRQLNELSSTLKQRRINHILRSDELKKSIITDENAITLATIHAIKGLEAKTVFVIGCNSQNFPCKGSEHPVMEMVKVEEYDKEEEERRLLYVAMSRAKHSLYLTYSGKNPTYFIQPDMLEIIEEQVGKKTKFSLAKSNDVVTKIKEWRTNLSKELGVPAFIIMHDRTMIDLAVKMPSTLQDLENVIGLGPAKISKYGEEILNVIYG